MNRQHSLEQAPHAEHPEPTGHSELTTNRAGVWRVVAAREAMVKLTDRNFLIGTVITIVLLLGLFGVQAFLTGRVSTRTVAAYSDDARAVITATHERVNHLDAQRRLEVLSVTDHQAGEQALRDGRAEALLERVDGSWQILTFRDAQESLTAELGQTVRERMLTANAVAAGTSVEALNRGTTLTSAALDPQAVADSGIARALAFAFAMLFYVAALSFGMQIAQSVVEEKQSRIVEILAAAIPVRQLLVGKVVGNTALAVGQMILYAAIGLLGAALTKQTIAVPTLLSSVGWFLVFFLAGFVALACAWAVAGSLASRTEDLQTTATPVTMLLVVAFFVGMSVDGSARAIASYVPIVSAITMPARIAASEASWWEPLVALALTLAMAALTIVAGERLYRRSLLQTRGRVSLRAAWAAEDEVAAR